MSQVFKSSPTKLQQIRDETGEDPTLVFAGWPHKKEKCPKSLHDYKNFREELTAFERPHRDTYHSQT